MPNQTHLHHQATSLSFTIGSRASFNDNPLYSINRKYHKATTERMKILHVGTRNSAGIVIGIGSGTDDRLCITRPCFFVGHPAPVALSPRLNFLEHQDGCADGSGRTFHSRMSVGLVFSV